MAPYDLLAGLCLILEVAEGLSAPASCEGSRSWKGCNMTYDFGS